MCMGRTHVLVAGTLGLACAGSAAHLLGHPMPFGAALAFGGVTAGMGVLPDLDHPQATLARTLGPVTKAVARVVCAASGGHRKGTHTVWFAALMVGLSTLLANRFGARAELPVAFVGFYLAAMILRLSPRPTSGKAEVTYLGEAAAATAAAYYLVPDWWWLPWAVGSGVLAHIVADCLTVEGVPVLFPLARRFVVRAPLLGRTDSAREHLFALLLAPALLWMIVATLTGNAWWTIAWVQHPAAWHLANAVPALVSP